MTALPIINQVTKPAGVAGQSRDDLDLYTGANPFQLSDGGSGGGPYVWSIVDQPPGAAATLTTPLLATTNLIGATVAGSYEIQLVKAGGASPGDIYRVVAAVQLALPSWSATSGLRIPAFGETTEFNVQSSPATGANTRGWAQEMDEWFRALAVYGFGVAVQAATVPVGTEPFYTINFDGTAITSVVDSGSGVVTVTIGTASAIDFQNNGADLPDNPYPGISSLGPVPPTLAGESLFLNQNAHFVPNGPGVNVGLRVTAAAHQTSHHGSGIREANPSLRSALRGTINTGPSPMTWTFAAMASGDVAISSGRIFPGTLYPGTTAFSLPATSQRDLYDLCLHPTTGVILPFSLAATLTTNTPFIVLDISSTHPTGAFNLSVVGNNVSWGGGKAEDWSVSATQNFLRLYHPNGVDWVEVFFYTNPVGAGTDSWTVATPGVSSFLVLARAPYWPDPILGKSRWGTGTTNYYRDMRQWDFQPIVQQQPATIQEIPLEGVDRRLDAAVVFTHRQPRSDTSTPSSYSSFGLLHSNAALDATGMEGGEFWVAGRRYVYSSSYTFSTSGITSTDVLIAAQVNANGQVSILVIAATSPLAALATAFNLETLPTLEGPQPRRDAICPLYWGRLNASSVLLGLRRVDLRRDAAAAGQWTVGGRAYQAELDYRLPLGSIRSTTPLGDAAAEFDSLSAALAYHGAWTGSDNLTTGNTVNAPCVTLHVIRSVYERYPVTLWRNVTIRGYGQPAIVLDEPIDGLDGFFRIGQYAANDGLGTVYNVEIHDVTFVAKSVSAPYASDGSLICISAPEWDTSDPIYAGHLPNASVQFVTFHGVIFGVADASNITESTNFKTLLFRGEVSSGGTNEAGFFFDITVRNCATVPFVTATIGSPLPVFNTFVDLAGAERVVISQSPSIFVVENNIIFAYNYGVWMHSDTGEVGLAVRSNWIVVFSITEPGFGVKIEPNTLAIFPEVISNHILYALVTDTSSAGIYLSGVSVAVVALNDLYAIGGAAGTENNGIQLAGNAAAGAHVRGNKVQGFRQGIVVSGESLSVSDFLVSENLVVCGAGTQDDFSCAIRIGTGNITDVTRTKIYNNTTLFARTGIILQRLSNESYDIAICGNSILGQTNASGTPSGIFGGRGIVVRYQTAPGIPVDVSICNNQIRNFLGIGADDFTEAYPNCGILFANATTSTFMRGLTISGNLMTSTTDGSPVDYTASLFGIAVIGAVVGQVISGNVISNEVVCTGSPTGGILCDCTGFSNLDVPCGPQIVQNSVRWLSATIAADLNFNDSAGILLRGSLHGTQVLANRVSTQSSMRSGDTTGGLIHNIMVDNTVRRLAIDGNYLSTEFLHSSITTRGANGCAVWCRGSIHNLSVSNNNCDGSWMRNPDAGVAANEPTGWGIIAVGTLGGSTGDNKIISGNNLKQVDPASSFGGMLVPNGIRFGSDLNGNGVLIAQQNIQICHNSVFAALNSDNSGGYSAGIAVLSIRLNGNAAATSWVMVQGNIVHRSDSATVDASVGILCSGANQCTFSDNRVDPLDGTVLDIADIAVGGSVQQNRWMDNVFGDNVTQGAYQLDAGVYRASPAPDNWDGTAYV